jgi:hypothetical protein
VSSTEQYVLVGVSRSRERWASDLARWSTSGAAPIEFVQCLTAEEALVVLGAGRRVSALVISARGPGVDRDLVATAAAAGTPTIVVSDGTVHRDWDALGVALVAEHHGNPKALIEMLSAVASPVDRSRRPGRARLSTGPSARRGHLIAVLGSGGTGCSSVAMAAAQGLGATVGTSHGVVLVDGAGRGDLAMYHHLGDVVPGLPELVEAHRRDRLDPDRVRELAFDVASRGYSVLLGRRRTADWVTLRRRSVDAALDALRRSYEHVVVDVDADLDGHHDTGSADVEDRHAVSLAAVATADLVIVVGRADLHGIHALARLVGEVLDVGVPAPRVVPVVVGAPRHPAARAGIGADLAQLTGARDTADRTTHPPVHLRRVRNLDDVHDRVAPLPATLCRPVSRLLPRLLAEVGPRPDRAADAAIRPGELGMLPAPGTDRRSEVA